MGNLVSFTKARRGRLLAAFVLAWTFLLGSELRAWAQTGVFDPESVLGPFLHEATVIRPGGVNDPFRLAVAGNTAIVLYVGAETIGIPSSTDVYERVEGGEWVKTGELLPPPPTTLFGSGPSVAFDGTTAIVAGGGAAHVFRRSRRGGLDWQEVAVLRPSDANPRFGTGVDVDGDHVIVGAAGDPLADTPGFVYVFRGRRHWHEVARLASPLPAQGMGWGFGRSVGISRDSAIVSEFDGTDSAAWILGRHVGGRNQWVIVRRFPETGSLRDLGSAPVDISGDTAVFARGDLIPTAYSFDRDTGGADAWGLQATYTTPLMRCCSEAADVSISADYVVLGAPSVSGVHILARNQGGPNAWGLVSMLLDSRQIGGVRAGRLGGEVSIDGDTVLLGSARQPGSPQETSTVIIVSDVDGDGLRDGIDPCLRDPLNNVDGACQRASAVYPVLDDLITQHEVTTTSRGRRFIITATFTNGSQTAIRNPFFEVTELTGGNELLNADAGPGGAGATLSPDVGDGILAPGESTKVRFVIGLQTRDPFQFHVSVRGDTGS